MTERGSATVLMVGVTGILIACLVGATAVGVAYAARAQATTAADAAALAAAVATYPGTGFAEPRVEAARAAARNGTMLASCVCPMDPGLNARTVTVRTAVTVDLPIFGRVRIHGSARAEFDPSAWLGH